MVNIDDEVFTLTEASSFLKKSPRTIRSMIRAGLIVAGKSGPKGKGHFEILKSACLEYVHNQQHNQAVNAEIGHRKKEVYRWHSNNVTEIGTAILSSREVAKGLGDALTRQTRGKRRSCMIS